MTDKGRDMELGDRLRELLTARGAALVGYADLHQVPAEARLGLPRGVSIAVALDPRIIRSIEEAPTRAYSALYQSVNTFLNELAAAAVDFLTGQGYRAEAWPSTGGIDDATLSVRVQHKTVATRAGLGWIGKTALLITPEFGGAQRFVSVLTDAPLPVGEAIDESRCGECRVCTDMCPSGASAGRNWRLGMRREELFDAFACREWSRGRAAKAGDGVPICGRCVAVCPHTQGYLKRSGA
jgi:epoxyqueuosine reductase QueG